MDKDGNQGQQGEISEGNTSLIPRRRVIPCKWWCFTLNNYLANDLDDIVEICKTKGFKYIIGKEVGESGTKHLQGFISCEKIQRLPEIVKNKRIHWEKAKAGEEANKKYCSKDGDYVTNFLRPEEKRKLLRIPEKSELRDWQLEVLDRVEENQDREIVWRYDELGGTGKTTLTKYLVHELGALCVDGKKADILYGASTLIKSYDEETLFYKKIIFILDLSRSLEGFVSYDSIEKLKNGLWYSSKYESGMTMIPPPVVIVFANFPPDKKKLSADRWNIKKISK